MARPSKGQLAGHFNQIKKVRIAVELDAQVYCSVKKLPGRPAKAMKRAILKFPTVKMKAMRVLEAQPDGIQYGCERFKNHEIGRAHV